MCIRDSTLSTPSYFENYSSLSKLLRVFSYCLRFIRNSRLPIADRNTSFLASHELQGTLLIFIRQSQRSHFNIEIKELEAQRSIPNNNNILSLNPFLDNTGILHVGERLSTPSSPMTANTKSYSTRILISVN